MCGIKLHPEMDHFNLDERILAPIFDKARDYGAAVIFHSGNTANTDPLIIPELAAQYPKVPVILKRESAPGGLGECRCFEQ